MHNKNPIIRKGRKEDIPQVYKLIKELATYEKAPNEVSVTEEELLRDGFGEIPFYGLFVAELESQIVGMALYYIKYSTWKGKCIYLEDLIVTQNMRGNKIGAKLFEQVMMVSWELKAPRMEWQVLDWNTPAINFYKKYQAVLDPEWLNGKLVFNQLNEFFTKK